MGDVIWYSETMGKETAFEMAASSVRFGAGVTREVGMDLADWGSRRVLVVTDPLVRRLRPAEVVLESLNDNKIACSVYDRVRVEPDRKSVV